MTQSNSFPLASATKVADYIRQQLEQHCVRFDIAGSIRRSRYTVKDIEVVCEPKREKKVVDLFGKEEEFILRDFTEALLTITDIVLMGNIEGRYMKIRTSSKLCPGIVLDLFMPQPDDYYRQLAIRTGSAEYAHQVLAAAWRRKGWVGVTDLGLRREEQCYDTGKEKKIWNLYDSIKDPELPPVWQSEMEFFTWLGVDYIDPMLREAKKHLNEAQ